MDFINNYKEEIVLRLKWVGFVSLCILSFIILCYIALKLDTNSSGNIIFGLIFIFLVIPETIAFLGKIKDSFDE